MLDEVIPKALTVLNADPRRVAIGGISMGGFGAYDLARLDPGRFCAVGGHSAAIWPTFTSPNVDSRAFDNARDFARNDVIAAATANPKLYGHAQLWLDVGAQDPYFIAADQQLANALHIHLHMARHARPRILERALERLPGLLRTRARGLRVASGDPADAHRDPDGARQRLPRLRKAWLRPQRNRQLLL